MGIPTDASITHIKNYYTNNNDNKISFFKINYEKN